MRIYDTEEKRVLEVVDANMLAETVKDTISYYEKKNAELFAENKQLRENALEKVNAELIDTIQSLREDLALSYGQFSSKKEKKAYEDFELRHMHNRLYSRAIDGRVPYLIPTGTGVGTILHVKCPLCGVEEDITDVEAW